MLTDKNFCNKILVKFNFKKKERVSVKMSKLSISIATYNNEKEVVNVLESIYKNTADLDFEIFVIDNNSRDKTVRLIYNKYPSVKVIEQPSNIGFGRSHNYVLNKINSKYHAVINPDITFNGNMLKKMVDYMDANSDVAMLTPKILNLDGTIQRLPRKKPTLKYLASGRLEHHSKKFKNIRDEYTMAGVDFKEPTEVDFCTGCFMFIKTETLKKLNGFDERFFMYFEDIDLTQRAKKYGKTIIYPDAEVYHSWNRDSAQKIKYFCVHVSSMLKYFKKWR